MPNPRGRVVFANGTLHRFSDRLVEKVPNIGEMAFVCVVCRTDHVCTAWVMTWMTHPLPNAFKSLQQYRIRLSTTAVPMSIAPKKSRMIDGPCTTIFVQSRFM